MPMTVRDSAFAVMRDFGASVIFGNPGSTELPMFRDFPSDFEYVLGLQEAVVVGMADGYAQANGRVVFVNLHSAAGVGNAMGNIHTAAKNRTPMVIIAGQQSRSILPFDPFLASDEATELPKPYVKWSVQPARADDVPQAIATACRRALQAPCGPVLVSVPADDWDRPAQAVAPRTVSRRTRPDAGLLADIATRLARSERPAFVVGAEVDRDGAWDEAVQLAERHGAAVWVAPMAARAGFPEDHRLFMGFLPAVRAQIVERLAGHDFVLVIGAPVFTYHVEGDGPHLLEGTTLCQLTEDAEAAARAPIGTSLVASVRLALRDLLATEVDMQTQTPAQARAAVPPPALVPPTASVPAPAPATEPSQPPLQKPASTPVLQPRAWPPPRPATPRVAPGDPLAVAYVLQTLADVRRPTDIVVEEAPTARVVMQAHLPMLQAGSFFTMASGGLGYGMPAAAGVAMALPEQRVIGLIGDGSSMYSIQTLWTAAQLGLDMTFVVLNNRRYAALKRFGSVLGFPADAVLPGTDLPGLDFVALAEGQGCRARRVTTAAELRPALEAALASQGPMLLEVVIA